ncbi:MAG: hypothetical protein EA350_04165 [Gemmatimonadales bacterium]|nr:MAG: hypothetical protein EA350_04165 [Gemmatimonadales bacterium]
MTWYPSTVRVAAPLPPLTHVPVAHFMPDSHRTPAGRNSASPGPRLPIRLPFPGLRMTDLIQCSACQRGFLVPPDSCPVCGAPSPAFTGAAESRGQDVVVSSRLNQTAQVGGIMIAGLLTGIVSWFLFSREMGVAMLLLALLVSAVLLWRR